MIDNTILNKYNIKFQIRTGANGKRQGIISSHVETTVNYHLKGYFFEYSIEFLKDEVLVEIDKAMSNQPFNNDAGGMLSFLEIGRSTSNFYDLKDPLAKVAMPTEDIKAIILAWIQWVSENELPEY